MRCLQQGYYPDKKHRQAAQVSQASRSKDLSIFVDGTIELGMGIMKVVVFFSFFWRESRTPNRGVGG